MPGTRSHDDDVPCQIIEPAPFPRAENLGRGQAEGKSEDLTPRSVLGHVTASPSPINAFPISPPELRGYEFTSLQSRDADRSGSPVPRHGEQ